MAKKSGARQRQNKTDGNDRESWQAIFVQHVHPRGQEIEFVHKELDTGYTSRGYSMCHSLAIFQTESRNRNLAGYGPWIVLVRLAGHWWFHLFANDAGPALAARFGKSPKLWLVSAGYDAVTQKSHFHFYKGGKRLVRFEATGPWNEPAEKLVFQSTLHKAAFRDSLSTQADTIGRLLKEQGAHRPPFSILQEGQTLRFTPRRVAGVKEICVETFPPIRSIKGSPSNRLEEAINAGSLAQVRKAIADGASLEFSPESSIGGPLHHAMFCRGKNWQEVVRELVKAGALIEGCPHEDPLIFACVDRLSHAATMIDAVKLALELGADINSRSRRDGGWGTALFHAISNNQLSLVKFLVSRGADLKAKNLNGETPRRFAERLYEPNPRIIEFLKAAEKGKVDTSDVEQLVQHETQVRRKRRRAARRTFQTRLEAIEATYTLKEQMAQAVSLAMPDEVDYVPTKKVYWRNEDEMKQWRRQFPRAGFQCVGQFTATPIENFKLIGWHHAEKSLYGVIYELEDELRVDLLRFHKGGWTCVTTNEDAFGAPWRTPKVNHHEMNDSSLADLVEWIDAQPQRDVVVVTAEEFVPRVKEVYVQTVKHLKKEARKMPPSKLLEKFGLMDEW